MPRKCMKKEKWKHKKLFNASFSFACLSIITEYSQFFSRRNNENSRNYAIIYLQTVFLCIRHFTEAKDSAKISFSLFTGVNEKLLAVLAQKISGNRMKRANVINGSVNQQKPPVRCFFFGVSCNDSQGPAGKARTSKSGLEKRGILVRRKFAACSIIRARRLLSGRLEETVKYAFREQKGNTRILHSGHSRDGLQGNSLFRNLSRYTESP